MANAQIHATKSLPPVAHNEAPTAKTALSCVLNQPHGKSLSPCVIPDTRRTKITNNAGRWFCCVPFHPAHNNYEFPVVTIWAAEPDERWWTRILLPCHLWSPWPTWYLTNMSRDIKQRALNPVLRSRTGTAGRGTREWLFLMWRAWFGRQNNPTLLITHYIIVLGIFARSAASQRIIPQWEEYW